MELPVLEVGYQARLTAPQADDVLVSASVGPSGEAMAVWTAPDDAPAVRPLADGPTGGRGGGVGFAGSRALWPVRARVAAYDPALFSVIQVSRLRLARPTVQPLPGGAVLLVGARCQWRADGADPNAVIYSANGKKVAEAVLGDGIEHVMTDTSGHVWVGYFDEGIAGSNGWGGDGAEPIGRCGLARLTPELKTIWRFRDDKVPFGEITDCYALNIDGESAWTSYYTNFPVVHVNGGAVEGWRNDVVGARAIAVAGARIALFSGYGANRDRLAIGVLRGGYFRVTCEYRLTLPDGEPLPPQVRVIGQGPTLHFFIGANWYQLTITDVPL